MPKSTVSQRTGDFGENHVQTIVETGWGCLFISYGGRDRAAIDGKVIDVVNGVVKPLEFNIQVKTGDFGNRHSNEFAAPVKLDHLEHWQQLNVPVVLVCVDTKPPTKAYWRLIRPRDTLPLSVSRRNLFGPGSRNVIVGAIRKALKQDSITPIQGRVLDVPLQSSVRIACKNYYKELKCRTIIHPTYGRINLTWKGWRHITRRKRSTRKIAVSLLLLPSLPEILRSSIQPVNSRELPSLRRSGHILSRTLLVFEAMLKLSHRGDARVRIIIERDILFSKDWATTDPKYNRRIQMCRFYSLSELPTKNLDGY